MSQKLFFFRPLGAPEDDRRRTRWFEPGTEPDLLTEDGETWELVRSRPRDTTQAFKCIKEGFRSISLPKFWPYARRHDKTGACIFESEAEALEAVRRARDAGEVVAWDR